MDYEDFYRGYRDISEKIQDHIANQKKLLNRLNRSMEKGDFRSAFKDIAAANENSICMDGDLSGMTELIESFDPEAYLDSGDFAVQLFDACREENIDIKNGEGTYEVFPNRVKIDARAGDVLINGRKAPGLRPRAVVAELLKSRSKLFSAPFNSPQFASELAGAYDLAVLADAGGKPVRKDADMYLKNVYKYLTPMRRFRREYDMRGYAFDLARLYASGQNELPDGRVFQFGPSRNNSKAIRILNEAGKEQFLATVRFYKP